MPESTHNSINSTIAPYNIKTDEEYMNEAQLAHFKAILLEWRRQLKEEAERTINHLKSEASTVLADPNDRASQEEEFNLELKSRDRDRKLLKKIDEALDRIDRKEFGYCESCGVEIGVRRLEARPTATLCIDCKTMEEIREKHRAM